MQPKPKIQLRAKSSQTLWRFLNHNSSSAENLICPIKISKIQAGRQGGDGVFPKSLLIIIVYLLLALSVKNEKKPKPKENQKTPQLCFFLMQCFCEWLLKNNIGKNRSWAEPSRADSPQGKVTACLGSGICMCSGNGEVFRLMRPVTRRNFLQLVGAYGRNLWSGLRSQKKPQKAAPQDLKGSPQSVLNQTYTPFELNDPHDVLDESSLKV